jgi:thiamine-phosphate pyrophosphorylase
MALPVDFELYLITDRHQVPAEYTLPGIIEAALQGGVKAVQLREKDLSTAELLPLARELRGLTRQYGARLLINDNVDVARAVEADGVHLGGHSQPADVVRQSIGRKMLIGVSTHSMSEIQAASEKGADFVTYGPVYATPSKAIYGAPQGLHALHEACMNSALPVFALGGITPERAATVRAAGAHGIALISAIIGSASPESAARAFSA